VDLMLSQFEVSKLVGVAWVMLSGLGAIYCGQIRWVLNDCDLATPGRRHTFDVCFVCFYGRNR
jgi:hypothetical protein